MALQFCATAMFAEDQDEQIYCEVSSMNFAWGYQHDGVFIDPKGSIGEYKYELDDSRWIPNRSDTHTLTELQEKYRPGRRQIGKVCPEQLLWMREQLNAVRYSPLSNLVDTGTRDGPTENTQCWIFLSDREVAQRVGLRERGTLESHNLASAAPALANWLEAVAEDARSKVHIPLKSQGCISYPPSLHQTRDESLVQSEQMRDQALRTLVTAAGLRCQMQEGHVSYVEGTNFRHHAETGTYDTLFDTLDFEKGTGRMVGIDSVRKVKPSVGPAGIVIEDEDSARIGTSRVMTVVPYKMGGQNRFPAITTTTMPSGVGVIVTQHIGSCTVIPRP